VGVVPETTKGEAVHLMRRRRAGPAASRAPGRLGVRRRRPGRPDGAASLAFRAFKGREDLSCISGVPRGPTRSREALMFPRKMRPGNPVWSADGKRPCYLRLDLGPALAQGEAGGRPVAGDQQQHDRGGHGAVFRSSTEYQRLQAALRGRLRGKPRTLILRSMWLRGRPGLLSRGNDVDRLYPSPDGRWLAMVQNKRAVPGRGNRVGTGAGSGRRLPAAARGVRRSAGR